MANAPKQSKKPQWMVTYWCARCEIDSARTELDPPLCFCCEKGDRLTEMKREELTPEVMANRMKAVADRMMENLRKAHNIAEADWPENPEEELMLLEAMAKGKDFQDTVHEVADQMTRPERLLGKQSSKKLKKVA